LFQMFAVVQSKKDGGLAVAPVPDRMVTDPDKTYPVGKSNRWLPAVLMRYQPVSNPEPETVTVSGLPDLFSAVTDAVVAEQPPTVGVAVGAWEAVAVGVAVPGGVVGVRVGVGVALGTGLATWQSSQAVSVVKTRSCNMRIATLERQNAKLTAATIAESAF
jgi:hypothetical protein